MTKNDSKAESHDASAGPTSDSWWTDVGEPLMEVLRTRPLADFLAMDDGANSEAGSAVLTWDAFIKEQQRAAERSRLFRTPADGKTLHAFTRNDSLGWDYLPCDASALIEWATAVVAARDNPGLLGTLH